MSEHIYSTNTWAHCIHFEKDNSQDHFPCSLHKSYSNWALRWPLSFADTNGNLDPIFNYLQELWLFASHHIFTLENSTDFSGEELGAQYACVWWHDKILSPEGWSPPWSMGYKTMNCVRSGTWMWFWFCDVLLWFSIPVTDVRPLLTRSNFFFLVLEIKKYPIKNASTAFLEYYDIFSHGHRFGQRTIVVTPTLTPIISTLLMKVKS